MENNNDHYGIPIETIMSTFDCIDVASVQLLNGRVYYVSTDPRSHDSVPASIDYYKRQGCCHIKFWGYHTPDIRVFELEKIEFFNNEE